MSLPQAHARRNKHRVPILAFLLTLLVRQVKALALFLFSGAQWLATTRGRRLGAAGRRRLFSKLGAARSTRLPRANNQAGVWVSAALVGPAVSNLDWNRSARRYQPRARCSVAATPPVPTRRRIPAATRRTRHPRSVYTSRLLHRAAPTPSPPPTACRHGHLFVMVVASRQVAGESSVEQERRAMGARRPAPLSRRAGTVRRCAELSERAERVVRMGTSVHAQPLSAVASPAALARPL